MSLSKQDRAYIKSWYFLAENITALQGMCFATMGFAPVTASDGSRWGVLPAVMQNALNFDDGKMYCLTSVDKQLPPGDVILGVILSIQDDVEDFKKLAEVVDTPPEYLARMNPLEHLAEHYLVLANSIEPHIRDFYGVSNHELEDPLRCSDWPSDKRMNFRHGGMYCCDFHRGVSFATNSIGSSMGATHPHQLGEAIAQGLTEFREIANRGGIEESIYARVYFDLPDEREADMFARLMFLLDESKIREKRRSVATAKGRTKRLTDLLV